jgi:hypothetical protein
MRPIRIISIVEEDEEILVSGRFMKSFDNDNYKGELI